jgi:hypothetical protein
LEGIETEYVGMFYRHLSLFYGILCGILVYCVVFWYILWYFGIFFCFGMLYQKNLATLIVKPEGSHLLPRSAVDRQQLNAGGLQHLGVGDGLVDILEDPDLARDGDLEAVVRHPEHSGQEVPLVLQEGPEVAPPSNDLESTKICL